LNLLTIEQPCKDDENRRCGSSLLMNIPRDDDLPIQYSVAILES